MADRVVRLHSGRIVSDERVAAPGRGHGARVVSRVRSPEAAPRGGASALSSPRSWSWSRSASWSSSPRTTRTAPEGLVRDRVRHPTASRRCTQRSERRRDRERRGAPARRTLCHRVYPAGLGCAHRGPHAPVVYCEHSRPRPARRRERVVLRQGRLPRSGEVLVEQHLADQFDLKPDSTIELFGPRGWQPVVVSGSGLATEYFWPARSQQEVMTSAEQFGVVFAPETFAKTLMDVPRTRGRALRPRP